MDDQSGDYSVSGAGTSDYSSGNTYDIEFGTDASGQDNLVLDGFSTSLGSYVFDALADWINLIRVDNAQVTGQRNLMLYETTATSDTTVSVRPERAASMEEGLESRIINRGSDNLFGNQGDNSGNDNNIERVDFVFDPGWVVPDPDALDQVGFIVLERGGNDTFKIAAITGVDDDGNPTSYSDLITGGTGGDSLFDWGACGVSLTTTVFRADNGGTDLKPSTDVPSQEINGVYFSLSDLGIDPNEFFYGYSLFGGDVLISMDLINPANATAGFPTDTSSTSGAEGGLDLIAGGTVLYDSDLGGSPLVQIPEPGVSVFLLMAAHAMLLMRSPRGRA